MAEFAVNFDTLQDIPPLRRKDEIPQVRISASGRVAMNKAMTERLEGRWDICVRTSPDYRFLVFLMDGIPNIHFPEKSAYVTHRELAGLLQAEEIELPAVYIMKWDEEHRAWVGQCQKLLEPPPVELLKHSKSSKRRGGKNQ